MKVWLPVAVAVAGAFILEGVSEAAKFAAAAVAIIFAFAASILIGFVAPVIFFLSHRNQPALAWGLTAVALIVLAVLLQPFTFARTLADALPFSH